MGDDAGAVVIVDTVVVVVVVVVSAFFGTVFLDLDTVNSRCKMAFISKRTTCSTMDCKTWKTSG